MIFEVTPSGLFAELYLTVPSNGAAVPGSALTLMRTLGNRRGGASATVLQGNLPGRIDRDDRLAVARFA